MPSEDGASSAKSSAALARTGKGKDKSAAANAQAAEAQRLIDCGVPGAVHQAQQLYRAAIADDPNCLEALHGICTLGLEMMRIGAMPIDAQRVLLEEVKGYLTKLMMIDPGSQRTCTSTGVLYLRCDAFDMAAEQLRLALAQNPRDITLRSQLACALGRLEVSDESLQIARDLVAEAPQTSDAQLLLANLATVMDSRTMEGAEALENALLACPRERALLERRPERQVALLWDEVEGAQVTDITASTAAAAAAEVGSGNDGGSADEVTPAGRLFGEPLPFVVGDEAAAADIPNDFLEQAVRLVRVPGPLDVEGGGAAYYNDTTLFGCTHRNVNDLTQQYVAGGAQAAVSVPHVMAAPAAGVELVTLVNCKSHNHYHWIAEGLTRLWAAEAALGTRAVYLVPPRDGGGATQHELLDLFGVPSERRTELSSSLGRHRFPTGLTFVDYYLPDELDRLENWPPRWDCWSAYLPPATCLRGLRRRLRRRLAPSPRGKTPYVLYIKREGIRAIVEGEERLLEALDQVLKPLGSSVRRFHVGDRAEQLTVRQQAKLFAGAAVVLGPHGAGLSNIIFCEASTQIVELPMRPHANNCFGYMSAALGLDYWVSHPPPLRAIKNLPTRPTTQKHTKTANNTRARPYLHTPDLPALITTDRLCRRRAATITRSISSLLRQSALLRPLWKLQYNSTSLA